MCISVSFSTISVSMAPSSAAFLTSAIPMAIFSGLFTSVVNIFSVICSSRYSLVVLSIFLNLLLLVNSYIPAIPPSDTFCIVILLLYSFCICCRYVCVAVCIIGSTSIII